jgi:hypothetical protein
MGPKGRYARAAHAPHLVDPPARRGLALLPEAFNTPERQNPALS